MSRNHQEGLLKCRLLGSTPRVPDSVDLGWGVKFHVLNKISGDAAFPGDHILRNTVLKKWYFWETVSTLYYHMTTYYQ